MATTKVRLSKDAPAQKHVDGVEPVRNDEGEALPVQPGDVIEVDAEIAGKEPSGTPGNKTYDPGSGLLAQTDKWEPGPKTVAPVNKES